MDRARLLPFLRESVDVYLIRHTRVLGAEGLCYGRSDLPLAEDFAESARRIGERLAFLAEPRVFTSPAPRCSSLARALCAHAPWPAASAAPELQELDFGAWEGRPWSALPRGETDPWAADFENIACPQGESWRDMARRVIGFCGRLRKGFQDGGGDGGIILVTHAGPIRALLSHWLGWTPRRAFDESIAFGSIRKIRLLEKTLPEALLLD